MPINNILAGNYNDFAQAYINMQQNNRANRAMTLQEAANQRANQAAAQQQQMNQQAMQLNELKLNAARQQQNIIAQRVQDMQNYNGDYKPMVDAAMQRGDIIGAEKFMNMDQMQQNMSQKQRDNMNKNVSSFSADMATEANAVMNAFNNSESEGRQALDAAIKKMQEKYPHLSKTQLPDFANMNSQEITAFMKHQQDTSMDWLKYKDNAKYKSIQEQIGLAQQKETVRHHLATEDISRLTARMKLRTGAGGFKAADANAIYRFAVGFYGGLVDDKGQLKILDPKKAKDVQDLSDLAAILYSRGKAGTHNEAVSMAAKMIGDQQAIPQTHIDYLIANPKSVKDFDQLHGQGMGEYLLQTYKLQ